MYTDDWPLIVCSVPVSRGVEWIRESTRDCALCSAHVSQGGVRERTRPGLCLQALNKIRVRSTSAHRDKLTPSHNEKREDRAEGKTRSLRFPPSQLRRILSQTSQRGNM